MTRPPAVSRSSFYLAMRILPKDQREAMFSVYRFCRAVDDVADKPEYGSPEQRLKELERWRHDIAAMFAGGLRPILPTSTAQRSDTDCGRTISRP